mmetsp:Transcript_9996/g.25509  ORF Transcript_9996/g.25509 Transcript_9996/m.25509 type:complete len:283 (-) Transcript_9996:222-1070(-)
MPTAPRAPPGGRSPRASCRRCQGARGSARGGPPRRPAPPSPASDTARRALAAPPCAAVCGRCSSAPSRSARAPADMPPPEGPRPRCPARPSGRRCSRTYWRGPPGSAPTPRAKPPREGGPARLPSGAQWCHHAWPRRGRAPLSPPATAPPLCARCARPSAGRCAHRAPGTPAGCSRTLPPGTRTPQGVRRPPPTAAHWSHGGPRWQGPTPRRRWLAAPRGRRPGPPACLHRAQSPLFSDGLHRSAASPAPGSCPRWRLTTWPAPNSAPPLCAGSPRSLSCAS